MIDHLLCICLIHRHTLGWFKTPVSSQTHKLMAATKVSDYLGPKYYKNAKQSKHFTHFRLANWPQSLGTYHGISHRYSKFSPSTKKVCSSDVMHCQTSIFETKMMVKIGVIFMPFSNPLPFTANLPVVSL